MSSETDFTENEENDRIIKLCNKFGVEDEELKNIEVGYRYELRQPIVIKKQKQGEVEEERITSVTIEKTVNRKLRRVYDKMKDSDALVDKMLFDLTSLTVIHIDELSDIDFYNLNMVITAFLPEPIMKSETENSDN